MVTASNKIIVTDNTGARELEGQELADFLAQRAKDKIEADKLKAIDDAKALSKAAILDRIGLTADELKTILG